jgi:hypothetical protein
MLKAEPPKWHVPAENLAQTRVPPKKRKYGAEALVRSPVGPLVDMKLSSLFCQAQEVQEAQTNSNRRGFVIGAIAWGVLLALPSSSEATELPVVGRSTFVINALLLAPETPHPKEVERELRLWIKKEAKRQDWGGGRANQVEARFELRTLRYVWSTKALHVSATLVGRLPSGRTAESTISFGGAAHKRAELTRQVLRIVATGVVTRLADIERKRRGL